MTEQSFIKIKAFCEVSDSLEAIRIRDELVSCLDVTSRIELGDVKKYWKIPEYFEISIKIFPKQINEDTLDKTANLMGCGWVKTSFSYVWNLEENTSFFVDQIKWANIELIE